MLSEALRFHRSLAKTPWQAPAPGWTSLEPGDIHVWRINLLKESQQINQYLPLLSLSEQERLGRFHYVKDRNNYLCCRGILRTLLGKYLSLEPYKSEFRYTEYGKPFLQSPSDLHFNLSHTDGHALLVFSLDKAIGVDAESVNDKIETETLVHRFFSPVEIHNITAIPLVDQPVAFFRLWTRKEALIKAHGAGLSLPLAQFGISVKEEEEVRVLHTDWAPEEAGQWSVVSFTVAPDTLGAIAQKAAFKKLEFYDFHSRAQPN